MRKIARTLRIVAAATRPSFEPVSDQAVKDNIKPVARPKPLELRPADARPRPAAL